MHFYNNLSTKNESMAGTASKSATHFQITSHLKNQQRAANANNLLLKPSK
jgi:hypothetical protein